MTWRTKCLLLACVVMLCMGSDCDSPTPIPDPGFRIVTYESRPGIFGVPTLFLDPGRGVNGTFINLTSSGTRGTQEVFAGTTNGSAFLDVPNGRAPGVWLVFESNGTCAGKFNSFRFDAGVANSVVCFVTFLPNQFTANPADIVADGSSTSVTINGQGFSSEFGMPTIAYYDSNGILVAQENASFVSNDGTSLQAAVPDLSLLASGPYTVFVGNWDAAGSWQMLGQTGISVHGVSPPAPPPPDPCGETRFDPCLLE